MHYLSLIRLLRRRLMGKYSTYWSFRSQINCDNNPATPAHQCYRWLWLILQAHLSERGVSYDLSSSPSKISSRHLSNMGQVVYFLMV